MDSSLRGENIRWTPALASRRNLSARRRRPHSGRSVRQGPQSDRVWEECGHGYQGVAGLGVPDAREFVVGV